MEQAPARHILSIATLLGECGVLQPNELGTITATAANDGLTIGQYLQKNGLVHPQVIRGAILCHLLLHKKLVSFAIAIDALKMTIQHRCKIELALSSLNWNRPFFENNAQASQLLLRSGLVNKDDMNLAYEICLRDIQSILVVLLKRGSITDVIADSVLTAQNEIEQKKLTMEAAIVSLRNGQTIDQRSTESLAVPKQLRLGEILIAADLISSTDLIAAIEKGRAEKIRFGQILVRDFGFPPELIQQACFVQSQINNQFVTIYDGIRSLSEGKTKRAN